jgi:hypothetical protein
MDCSETPSYSLPYLTDVRQQIILQQTFPEPDSEETGNDILISCVLLLLAECD